MVARKQKIEEVFLVKDGRGRWATLKPGSDLRYRDFHRLPFRHVEAEPKKYDFKLNYTITITRHQVFVQQTDLRELKTLFPNLKITWLSDQDLDAVMLPAIDRKIFKALPSVLEE